MPKVTVEHSTALSPDDAFAKLKSFFETDQDIRRLDPKIQCQFTDSSMTGQAKGSQFKADMSVKPAAGGSAVAIIVDLPLLLTPLKGKVQETIQKKLAKYLG